MFRLILWEKKALYQKMVKLVLLELYTILYGCNSNLALVKLYKLTTCKDMMLIFLHNKGSKTDMLIYLAQFILHESINELKIQLKCVTVLKSSINELKIQMKNVTVLRSALLYTCNILNICT